MDPQLSSVLDGILAPTPKDERKEGLTPLLLKVQVRCCVCLNPLHTHVCSLFDASQHGGVIEIEAEPCAFCADKATEEPPA